MTTMMPAVKSIVPGILPAVTIDRTAAKPLYRQLCDAYREAIVERRPAPALHARTGG